LGNFYVRRILYLNLQGSDSGRAQGEAAGETEESNEQRTVSSVSHDENDSGYAASFYFLFRSMMIGAVFAIPGVFFPQTRKVLRFLRDLEAVQDATNLFQLVIVLTLLGLILQGLFYVLRSGLRSLKPHFDAKGTKESVD
jgi:hypothetical protein